MPGASRTQRAASPWAKRRPPSSRAMAPVSSTRPAPASAGARRMAESEDAGSQQDAEGGEPLGKAASAQFAGDGAGEQHQAGAGERGSQADGRERRAEQSDLDAADEGDHGRDIHVSPVEMAGERDVVQVVDEVAVVAAGVEVKDQLDGRDARHQHSGGELPGGAWFRHGVGGQADPGGYPGLSYSR